MVNQYRELNAAVKVYRDKYGYWPGDDPRADVHVGVQNSHNGDGNEKIMYMAPLNRFEYALSSEHLQRAGLIAGSYNGEVVLSNGFFPQTPILHAFNEKVTIIQEFFPYGGKVTEGIAIRFDCLPPDAARALDVTLDDGLYNSGFIRGIRLDQLTGWQRLPQNYTDVPAGARLCVICFMEMTTY